MDGRNIEPVVPEHQLALIHGEMKSYWFCGTCGRQVFKTMFDYCPKCGSKIDWTGADDED